MAEADFSASKASALLLAGADDLLDFVDREPRKAGGPFAAGEVKRPASAPPFRCDRDWPSSRDIKLRFCLLGIVEVLERAADDLQTLQHGAQPFFRRRRAPHRVSGTSPVQVALMTLVALTQAVLRALRARELIAGRQYGVLDLVDRQIGRARQPDDRPAITSASVGVFELGVLVTFSSDRAGRHTLQPEPPP